jgi:hypothetical protein
MHFASTYKAFPNDEYGTSAAMRHTMVHQQASLATSRFVTERALFGALRRDERVALGAMWDVLGAADEPTVYVRRTPSESTYRSSVVILSVAATLTWLAVVLICLLA